MHIDSGASLALQQSRQPVEMDTRCAARSVDRLAELINGWEL